MTRVEPDGKGTWRQVAAVVDGKRIPVGPGAVLTVDAGGYTVTVNGKVYQRGTSKADYDRTPHQADVTVAEGPQAGQTLLQIFRVEGDVLIACIAPPGAARPTEFTSRPASGHTLSVWLRADAAEASHRPWAALDWRFFLLVIVFLAFSKSAGGLRQDLEASLGYWPAVGAGVLAGAAVVTALGLALKWGWRAGLTLGLTMAVAITLFEELRKALDPTLGPLGTLWVSGSTACVTGLAAGVLLGRLLKLRW